jgi:hypothetical protein
MHRKGRVKRPVVLLFVFVSPLEYASLFLIPYLFFVKFLAAFSIPPPCFIKSQ